MRINLLAISISLRCTFFCLHVRVCDKKMKIRKSELTLTVFSCMHVLKTHTETLLCITVLMKVKIVPYTVHATRSVSVSVNENG